MTLDASRLRITLTNAEREYTQAKAAVERMEASCSHQWKELTPEHQTTGGYETQSLMGHFTKNSDGSINAPRIYIPPRTITTYHRMCEHCGKSESTQNTQEETHVTTKPMW